MSDPSLTAVPIEQQHGAKQTGRLDNVELLNRVDGAERFGGDDYDEYEVTTDFAFGDVGDSAEKARLIAKRESSHEYD